MEQQRAAAVESGEAIERAAAAHQQAISGVQSAYQSLENSVNAERQILQNAYSATTDSINANISTVQDAMQESASVASTLSNSLDGLLSARRRESMASRRSSQSYLRSTLASGGLGDTDQLERALGVVSEPSEGLFSSFTDYQRDFYQTANVIAELEARADEQVTVEERSLRALNRQLETAERQHEREMATLDSMLVKQQIQIENELGQMAWLENINGSVLTVSDAIGVLGSAISAAEASAAARDRASAAASSESGSSSGYRVEGNGGSATYFTPDGSYTIQGTTAEELRKIYSDKLDGSHANGLSNVPFDGYRAMLHKGEDVLPAPIARLYRDSAPAANNGEAMAELVAEVKQLRSELAASQRAIAENTRKTSRVLEREELERRQMEVV
jgi:hypothetical protein